MERPREGGILAEREPWPTRCVSHVVQPAPGRTDPPRPVLVPKGRWPGSCVLDYAVRGIVYTSERRRKTTQIDEGMTTIVLLSC